MEATFLDLNKTRTCPAEYDVPVPDCTQEQNGSPQLSFIVRHYK